MRTSLNSIPLNGTSFKIKRVQTSINTLLFLVLFGAAFIGFGAFTYFPSKIDSSWKQTEGTVVSVSRSTGTDSVTYTPVIEYGVNGKDYTVKSNFSSSSRPAIGSSRGVAYNPSNPSEAKLEQGGTAYVFTILFPLIGAVTILLGVFSFIKSRKRNEEIKELLQNGTKITGVVTDLTHTAAASRSRRNSSSNKTYIITVAATGPQGETKHYKSDRMTGAVGLSLSGFQANPVPIDVYINPAKPDSYYVDISGIPDFDPQKLVQLAQNPAAMQQQQVPPTPPFTTSTTPPTTPPPVAPATPSNSNQPPKI